MSKKKLVLAVTAVVLVLTMAIGGTLAYFTDTTDTYENTFTVGNVNIDLNETSVGSEDGTVVAGEKDGNGFKYESMKPGFTYSKVPVVSVEKGSEDCYVFLKMDMTKYVSLVNLMMLNEGFEGTTTDFVKSLVADKTNFQSVIDKWFVGIEHAKWQIMNLEELATAFATWTTPGSNPVELSLVLGYIDGDAVMSAGDSATFMTGFAIPATVTSEMMTKGAYANGNSNISGMKMDFTAYAIQADGIADIEAAYTELFPAPAVGE